MQTLETPFSFRQFDLGHPRELAFLSCFRRSIVATRISAKSSWRSNLFQLALLIVVGSLFESALNGQTPSTGQQPITDSTQSFSNQNNSIPILSEFLKKFSRSVLAGPTFMISATASDRNASPLATIVYQRSGKKHAWTQTIPYGTSLSVIRTQDQSKMRQNNHTQSVHPTDSFFVDMYDPIGSLVDMAARHVVDAHIIPRAAQDDTPASVVLKNNNPSSGRRAYWWISASDLLPQRVVVDNIDLVSRRPFSLDIRFSDYKEFTGRLVPTMIQIFSNDGLIEAIHVDSFQALSGNLAETLEN